MNTNNAGNIVDMIDEEIARLSQARNLLAESPTHMSMNVNGRMIANKAYRGRMPGSKNKPKEPIMVKKKKRNLSPEGRERIAEAVRRRWANQKAATAAPAAAPAMMKAAKKAPAQTKASAKPTLAKKAVKKKGGGTQVAVDGPTSSQA